MADIKNLKAIAKRFTTYSLVLLVVILNIWLLNNGEAILPPEIYTQRISIIYGIILAVIMAIWFVVLYAEKRTHIIRELYEISIKDSVLGMCIGTIMVILVFWLFYGAILGHDAMALTWEMAVALVILHGVIVAPIETITAQKMVVDMMGKIPAAIFFASMHGAVYGFNLGTLTFAFTMGYIWSRLIEFKSDKWYYGMFGMGFVIAWHAMYNIGVTVYRVQMLSVLSFAGPIALVMIVAFLIFKILCRTHPEVQFSSASQVSLSCPQWPSQSHGIGVPRAYHVFVGQYLENEPLAKHLQVR